MLSCVTGPVIVAVVLGVPPLVWVSMFVSLCIYIFASQATTAKRKQVARYARSGEVLERIDQLLEGRSRDVNRAAQSHLTSVLHEAKNELTPAAWNLDIIARRGDLTDDERRALEESKVSIEETLASIQGILSQPHADVEEDACYWLPDLGPAISGQSDDGPTSSIFEIGELPETTVGCPLAYTKIAIRNLLDNSVEAGAKRAVLEGRMDEDAGSVVLTFSDNGPGLPEQVQQNLFKPFNTHGKDGGVGLGIYLSRRMIDAAGGELRLLSTGPDGTVFEIELPAINTK
jgi:signal transduction histidine kinase